MKNKILLIICCCIVLTVCVVMELIKPVPKKIECVVVQDETGQLHIIRKEQLNEK